MNMFGRIAGRLAIILSLFALQSGHVAAKAFRVRVSEPGTLAQLIGERNKNRITALKVNGRLNSSDLRFLREMAGCDAWEKPTAGRLSRIDMGEVTFASGESPIPIASRSNTPRASMSCRAFCSANARS